MSELIVTTNYEQVIGGSRPVVVNERTGQVRVHSTNGLLVNSALRKDEWEELDRAVIRAAQYPLRAVGDLFARGLTKRLGGLGSLVSQWNVATSMTPATVTMTGQSVGDQDRIDFNLAGVPIPVIFKEFTIGRRTLDAARRMNDQLDTVHAEEAARVVAEKMEAMLIDGGGFTFNGVAINGYTSLSTRNTDTATNYGGGDWGTIANVQTTIAGMIAAAKLDNKYGPYAVYAHTTQYGQAAYAWFTDGSGQTARQRVLEIPSIVSFEELPTLQAGEILLVQVTPDVADWAFVPEFQTPTVMEWASPDGMTYNFKVMAVGAPRVKSHYDGKCGIVHATAA